MNTDFRIDSKDTPSRAAFSLLTPDGAPSCAMKESADAAEALGFGRFFDLKNSTLAEHLTCDRETIEYRAECVRDLVSTPEALKALHDCIPVMSDITDLRRLGSGADSADEYLYGITEVELYISLLDILERDFLPLKERFSSRAMRDLAARAETLTTSDGAKEIREALSELSTRVGTVKSVTLGVNLDGRLFPESAGILALHGDKFRSPQGLERVLRLDFKQGERDFISPLSRTSKILSDHENEALRASLNSALAQMFKSSFKSWKRIIKTYVLENTDFLLGILPEIEFLTLACDFISRLETRGVTLTYPEITEGADLEISGLISPVIALSTDGELVPNDVSFDERGRIFVVTGPNRGGKSVFTCAVGQAVIMASLGLPVCAKSAKIGIADNVFCHFPNGDDTVERGRLGEECQRLSEIVSKITAKSVVLLDESLSSTGSYEASSIAEELLSAFSVIGCRTIFSTHLHALAARVDEINARTAALGGGAIDNLVAEISSGERSFKVLRAKPEGKSYASDIAKKYGLSLDEILKKAGSHE